MLAYAATRFSWILTNAGAWFNQILESVVGRLLAMVLSEEYVEANLRLCEFFIESNRHICRGKFCPDLIEFLGGTHQRAEQQPQEMKVLDRQGSVRAAALGQTQEV